MDMIKKEYMMPTMKVVQLHHRTRLLVGSEQTEEGLNKKLRNESVEEAW